MHLQRYTPADAAARALRLKQRGTEDFKAKSYDGAASKYSCAAEYAAEAGQLAEPALLGSLLLNEAQCRLNLHQPQGAAALCSRVLEREPHNVKALYRRAVAALEQAEYVDARRDLTNAAKLDPKNRDVRVKLAACQQAAAEQKSRERRLYAAMIGGGANGDETGIEGGDGASDGGVANGPAPEHGLVQLLNQLDKSAANGSIGAANVADGTVSGGDSGAKNGDSPSPPYADEEALSMI